MVETAVKKPLQLQVKGLKDPRARHWDAPDERGGQNAPGLIQWLLNLLKALMLTVVCFDAVLKPSSCSSHVLLVIMWPCCLGCWELIQRAIKWPSHLCYCVRTAKICLLWHRGEGVPLQCQQCSSWACLYKENTWLCTHRVFLGEKKKGGSRCMVERNAVHTPWRHNTFSGSLLENCLQPSLLGWRISSSLSPSQSILAF